MKLKDFLKEANELLAKHPEAGELELFQTSCFDDPYRFATSGIYIGEVWSIGEGESQFNNEETARERMEENEFEGNPTSSECVVIEAY